MRFLRNPLVIVALLATIGVSALLGQRYVTKREGARVVERFYRGQLTDEPWVQAMATRGAFGKLEDAKRAYGRVVSFKIDSLVAKPGGQWECVLTVEREKDTVEETVANVSRGAVIRLFHSEPTQP